MQSEIEILKTVQGILLCIEDEKAKVLLIDEYGTEYCYYFPKSNLLRAGITMIYQPFRIETIEYVDDSGRFIQGQRYEPLVKKEDAYFEKLKLNYEYSDKLNEIKKYFNKGELK